MFQSLWSRVLVLSTVGIAVLLFSSAVSPASDEVAPERPVSIIFFLPDGMGIGQHSMAFYLTDDYPFARFGQVALMTTHPHRRDRVTESASGAGSLATGEKIRRRVISMSPEGKPLESVMEVARAAGMATGVVTTANLSDASPAAFSVHHTSRYEQTIIAKKMIRSGLNVMLGGGRKVFLSKRDGGENDSDYLGQLERGDAVQVLASLQDPLQPSRQILGLFAMGEMEDVGGRNPTLLEMTQFALDRLEDDPDGFFLFIEEELTDSHSHNNLHGPALEAVAAVNRVTHFLLDYQAAHPEVLLVVAPDHETGGWFLEEKRDNPGKPKWATGGHTGNMVPVFAIGPGSGLFKGIIDNTDVGKILLKYLRQKK